jgi:hypothetical protein
MTRTSWPRAASHAAISPEYFPMPSGSGEKFVLQIRTFIGLKQFATLRLARSRIVDAAISMPERRPSLLSANTREFISQRPARTP